MSFCMFCSWLQAVTSRRVAPELGEAGACGKYGIQTNSFTQFLQIKQHFMAYI